MVPAIDVGGELRRVLAAQAVGDQHRQAAEHQAVGILRKRQGPGVAQEGDRQVVRPQGCGRVVVRGHDAQTEKLRVAGGKVPLGHQPQLAQHGVQLLAAFLGDPAATLDRHRITTALANEQRHKRFNALCAGEVTCAVRTLAVAVQRNG